MAKQHSQFCKIINEGVTQDSPCKVNEFTNCGHEIHKIVTLHVKKDEVGRYFRFVFAKQDPKRIMTQIEPDSEKIIRDPQEAQKFWEEL